MKHIERYEDFAYHSELEENILNLKKRREDNWRVLDTHKCLKCKIQKKPEYTRTTREIPRIF